MTLQIAELVLRVTSEMTGMELALLTLIRDLQARLEILETTQATKKAGTI